LVAAKQRVLDLLAEKRKAIITTAVTRGLDLKVTLRDSGVPWLGEIPAHWKTKRMKYLFRLVADRAPLGNDFELLSLYTDIGVKPRRELEERGNKASTTDEYWLVQPGDLIVNKLLAWMGAFGVSSYSGVTSPAYDILRPQHAVEPFYYHHLFRCGVATTEVRARSYGIMDMRLRLYFDRLGDMYVPCPDHEEQQAIVEYITRETARIDAVRTATERTVELLKERRAALIAAAVTGQLDLRAAA
jgi:type I restriction enzyme S subunit